MHACPIEIPVIETERLRLRGHTIEDASLVRRLWTDPEVTRYIGARALTAEECWSRLLRYAGHWSFLGFGYWILEEKVTGDFVGEVGFADYQREVEPGLGAVPEAGWVLTPQKQGMGYATEAVRAVLDWGKEHLAAALVSCLIHPDHHASIRVARRCGFIKRQLGSYNGKPVLIFDLLLSDAGGSGKNG